METREEVHRIVEQIINHFSVDSPAIPSLPKKGNYEGLQYWEQGPWQAIRNNSKIKPSDTDSPILSLYFEDEDGNEIPLDVKEEVRGDLFAYWLDMAREGEVPVPYKKLGFKRQEDFRKVMEGKYPWFRLCDGHWKVKQLWINHWKKDTPEKLLRAINETNSSPSTPPNYDHKLASTPNNQTAGPTKLPKKTLPTTISIDSSDSDDHTPRVQREPLVEGSVIEISSSDSLDGSPTNQKRKSDDDSSPVPSKKIKGKEREAPAPAFHPPKPVPKKKIQAKVGKVSNISPPFFKVTLKRTQVDPLYLLIKLHPRQSS